jgi:hypothetical protein
MRYLVNLPLLGALLCGGLVFYLTVLAAPRGGDAGLGQAYALTFGGILFWILIAVTVLGCAATGGFDWVSGAGGARVMLVLFGFVAIVVVLFLPFGIALETAGRFQGTRWDTATIWASRAAGLGIPLLLLLYAAWMINAPETLRSLPLVRNAALAGMAGLLVAAAAVSVRELARWNREAAVEAAAQRTEEDEQAVARRRAFEALTDADPLLAWDEYTYHSSADDIRLAAMRRIAARPNIDSELIRVLAAENTNWAAEGVRLVAELDFKPSPDLAEAVRRRLDAYAQDLADKPVTYEGDKRLDYYEQSRLREALAVARKLAETPGADLRPQVNAIRKAVALYPKSETAGRFPREAAETEKQIAARLGAPR